LPAPPPDWQPSITPDEYRAGFERIRGLIRAGDTYQVNYSYRLRAPFHDDPWEIFLRLAAAQHPTIGAFVPAGDWTVCSASPELFFRLEGDRIESRPMKGTAPRGLTLDEDLERAEALRASEKDRAENVMIVDMVRNDLGRVAQTGTVRVTRLFDIEKYPTLWQMTSTVEARTRATPSRILQALFPAASITGAPKPRTMEIIAEVESTPRRLYTGAIGFIAPDGRAQFNVAIRTLLVEPRRGTAEYGVGGGVVWDSRPDLEQIECRTKARILEEPPPPDFRLLETLRWTPAEGFFLLDRHLRRLARSAAYFDFALDAATVRQQLEQAASRLPPQPHRVRLLLDRHGAAAIESAPLTVEPDAAPGSVALAQSPVEASNVFLYHKTTNRRVYEEAVAGRPGMPDVILYNGAGEITESTIANVVVEVGGVLCTPPVRCGLLAGTLRELLLERGEIRERAITIPELLRSPRVLLANSVRGLYPVRIVAKPVEGEG
jgi:para-aminobenzoate synthetase/4-amino-4-deoxychorismate lyase